MERLLCTRLGIVGASQNIKDVKANVNITKIGGKSAILAGRGF